MLFADLFLFCSTLRVSFLLFACRSLIALRFAHVSEVALMLRIRNTVSVKCNVSLQRALRQLITHPSLLGITILLYGLRPSSFAYLLATDLSRSAFNHVAQISERITRLVCWQRVGPGNKFGPFSPIRIVLGLFPVPSLSHSLMLQTDRPWVSAAKLCASCCEALPTCSALKS